MDSKYKGHVSQTQPANQAKLIEDFIEVNRRNQLINLMQWLKDECQAPNADVKNIKREFFKKSTELRRSYDR